MNNSINETVILEKFDSNQKISEQTLKSTDTWKKHSRMWGDKMHRICSYVAMFPPTLANYFIDKYSNEGDVVLDTFSGRGTTLLESRILNRITYAIDLNPFAYILSKSKAQSYQLQDVVNRINTWEYSFYQNDKKIKIDQSMRVFYSKRNLIQLSFIKNNYGDKWRELDEIDNFILSITLGLMHGPARKNQDTMYFSLSMSNCISMSSNYVKNYARNKKLKYPKDNIFQKIRNRAIEILQKSDSNKNDNFAHVYFGNSLEIENYMDNVKPNLIFTSPPYLNIVNYTKQNWIKMWLLGFDTNKKNKSLKLDDYHNINEYINFMHNYLNAVLNIMNENTTLALVIGDVQKNDKIYSFSQMWDENLKYRLNDLILNEIYTDEINQNKKATNSMGKKAGKATRIDKIYIFKKINL
ncbi:DNA methyltransferase [Spiroplasma endosymbiont of Labia minor]|uniref:DNA methyltransferase n=1 Tax=Spiroplasma endosymbiont of Labia minor TaxID=3066305 RepID=UPI0030D1769F